MRLIIGGKLESRFVEPLGLLSDFHCRIEKFLRNLSLIAQQAQGGILVEEHRRALEIALQYFREAASRHMRDEEASLFPKLRVCDDPAVQSALGRY